MKSKHFFSKPICFLLLLSLIVSLTGCKKNRKYNAEEVLTSARLLIEKSTLFNEIYYGAGIPYSGDLSEANGIYRKALDDYMDKQAFSTIEELRRLTQEVYSSGLSEIIFSTKLSSVSDDDGIRSMARYYQKYDGDFSDIPAYIMVNSETENLLPDTVEYLYDTLRDLGSEGEKVYVSILARVTNGDGQSQEHTLRIALLEEAAGWRLDSPTYLRYNAELEKYEKLK